MSGGVGPTPHRTRTHTCCKPLRAGNYHGCDISEDIILQAAQQLKASGLQDKGYEYVWVGE